MIESLSRVQDGCLIVTRGSEISLFLPTPASKLKSFTAFRSVVIELAPPAPEESHLTEEQIIKHNQETIAYYSSQVEGFFEFLPCELGDTDHIFGDQVVEFIKNIHQLNYPEIPIINDEVIAVLGDPSKSLEVPLEQLLDYSSAVAFKRERYQFEDSEYLLLELLKLEPTQSIALDLWRTCDRTTLIKYISDITDTRTLSFSHLKTEVIKQLISEQMIAPLKGRLLSAIDRGVFKDTANWKPMQFPGKKPAKKPTGDLDERLKALDKKHGRT